MDFHIIRFINREGSTLIDSSPVAVCVDELHARYITDFLNDKFRHQQQETASCIGRSNNNQSVTVDSDSKGRKRRRKDKKADVRRIDEQHDGCGHGASPGRECGEHKKV